MKTRHFSSITGKKLQQYLWFRLLLWMFFTAAVCVSPEGCLQAQEVPWQKWVMYLSHFQPGCPDTTLADRLNDALINSLARHAGIHIIEPDDSVGMLWEEAGVSKLARLKQIGRHTRCHYIIYGQTEFCDSQHQTFLTRIYDVKREKDVDFMLANCIDLENMPAYADQITCCLTNIVCQEGWTEAITAIQNPHAGFQVQIDVPNSVYYAGDQLNIAILSEKSVYAYLFDVGTSGRVHLLFPNQHQAENRIAARQSVRIENVHVSGPVGMEVLKLLVTLDPVPLEDVFDYVKQDAIFQALSDDPALFSKGFHEVVDPMSDSRWATDTKVLEIKE